MSPVHPAEHQIPREPAPMILKAGLIGQRRRAESLSRVVCLDQDCRRIHSSDCPHGKGGRAALLNDRLDEGGVRVAMGVPMAVQGRESRRSSAAH